MKHIKLFMLIFTAGLLLCGCGKSDPALNKYKKEMTAFTEEITALVDSIEGIDSASEERTHELLGYLDEMDVAFAEMSELDVPEQFSNIEPLADEASANMSEAVSLFHQALDNPEVYDENVTDAAFEYYNRAFKRIEYMGTILQGELPDDENVTIIDDTETDENSDEDLTEDTDEDSDSDTNAVG